MIDYNSELQKIYTPYYNELKNRVNELPCYTSNPLLMHVFDEYDDSTVKLLIVGKETNSWAKYLKDSLLLEDIIKEYKEFELGHGYTSEKGKKRILCSPFWNFSRSFYCRLNSENNRKKKGFMWTNLSKFDTGLGRSEERRVGKEC